MWHNYRLKSHNVGKLNGLHPNFNSEFCLGLGKNNIHFILFLWQNWVQSLPWYILINQTCENKQYSAKLSWKHNNLTSYYKETGDGNLVFARNCSE
jgi:hypothetical protein